MKKTLIVIVIVVILIVLYSWGAYNGLITMRETATAQWQQVETDYQRRFDLIPNLVETVKGGMKQEQSVFTAIADARTHYSGASSVSEKAAAAGEVESAFARLLVVMENYPQLKSLDAVQGLMTQLEGTENRISVARMRFNESVKTYDIAIQRFPRSIVASIFGFDKLNYFEAKTVAENAPAVQF